MRIFLLGFMGVGKTYWANIIARHFKIKKYDLDQQITAHTKMLITDIFAKHGEAYFRKKEQEYLLLFKQRNNFVLSCGGGTPCFFDNMEIMNNMGLTIWINEAEELVFERLKEGKLKRPLIAHMNDTELKFFIKNKNLERKQFYNKAKMIVHTGDNIVQKILNYD